MSPIRYFLAAGLAVPLVACANEPEEAPDITEAIPVEDTQADTPTDETQASRDRPAPADATPEPLQPEAAPAPRTAEPETPGPATKTRQQGSKLQRADPDY